MEARRVAFDARSAGGGARLSDARSSAARSGSAVPTRGRAETPGIASEYGRLIQGKKSV